MWKIKQAHYGANAGKYYAYKFVLTNEDFVTKYWGSPNSQPQYFDNLETLKMNLNEGKQRFEEHLWVDRLRELQNA